MKRETKIAIFWKTIDSIILLILIIESQKSLFCINIKTKMTFSLKNALPIHIARDVNQSSPVDFGLISFRLIGI